MVTGNWTFSAEGIVNNLNPFRRIFINRFNIDKIDIHDDRSVYYYMSSIANYSFIDVEDIEAFNLIFVYALGAYNLTLSMDIYNNSILE